MNQDRSTERDNPLGDDDHIDRDDRVRQEPPDWRDESSTWSGGFGEGAGASMRDPEPQPQPPPPDEPPPWDQSA